VQFPTARQNSDSSNLSVPMCYNRLVPIVKCCFCGKKIYRSNGRINENRKFSHNFYCSSSCQGNYLKRRAEFICENRICNKKFERLHSAISTHNFCSQTCAAIINNRKFPKRHPKFRICKYCSIEFRGLNIYCSGSCFRKGRNKYSLEQLISIIKSAARERGRAPAKRELSEIAEACVYRFGTWNKGIKAAHLSPNRSDNNRMYKRAITKANDGHLCDSISEAIIDNWLTNNDINHKRDVCYPSTRHRADWGLDNGTYVEYFGLAQDSPRYDRNIQVKKELCKKYGIRLIAIYPQDLYPRQNLKLKFHGY